MTAHHFCLQMAAPEPKPPFHGQDRVRDANPGLVMVG